MRKKVAIRYSDRFRALAPHDPATGELITDFSELTFGDTPEAQAGVTDDAGESIKGFSDATIDAVTRRVKDHRPSRSAVLVGWITVPDK